MIPSIDLLLPTEILTIIDAIITAVLAVITYYYAKEIGLFRNTGQNPPKFSLESRIYAFENNSKIMGQHFQFYENYLGMIICHVL
jgi:hypothetical protein